MTTAASGNIGTNKLTHHGGIWVTTHIALNPSNWGSFRPIFIVLDKEEVFDHLKWMVHWHWLFIEIIIENRIEYITDFSGEETKEIEKGDKIKID